MNHLIHPWRGTAARQDSEALLFSSVFESDRHLGVRATRCAYFSQEMSRGDAECRQWGR